MCSGGHAPALGEFRLRQLASLLEIGEGCILRLAVSSDLKLAAFRFFLGRAIEYRDANGGARGVPSRTAWLVFGYGLFFWASFDLIGVEEILPDMLVTAALYSVAGIVLRILTREPLRAMPFVALGAVLGAAYWVKAAMLPVGIMFLLAVALAAACLAVVAAPLVTALSVKWARNDERRGAAELHVEGEPAEIVRSLAGGRESSERQIFANPALFDPSYWAATDRAAGHGIESVL